MLLHLISYTFMCISTAQKRFGHSLTDTTLYVHNVLSPSLSLFPGRNQFQGCYCRGLCEKKTCPCFSANRECDADLCKTCGAGAVAPSFGCEQLECMQHGNCYCLITILPSVEDFSSRYTRCKNLAIQRGQRKVGCGRHSILYLCHYCNPLCCPVSTFW